MRKSSPFVTLTTISSLMACLVPTTNNLPEEGFESNGSEAPSGESTDGETEAEKTEGGPGCDLSTHACISNVPNGWNGPVALTDGECGGAFERNAIETFAAIVVVESAKCDCDCDDPADGVCATTTQVDIYPLWSGDGVPHNAGVCDTLAEQVTAVAGDPAVFPTNWNWDDTHVIVHPIDVAVPGSCVAFPTVTIPELEVEGVVRACEPTEAFPACDDGSQCVPQPADGMQDRVCIWAMGEQVCPAGTDFVDREVRKTGIHDTRTCSECTCDPANGESCNEASATFQRTGAGGSVSVDADGECRSLSVGGFTWSTISFDPGTPEVGACEPRGGQPEGGVSAHDEVTFCCT